MPFFCSLLLAFLSLVAAESNNVLRGHISRRIVRGFEVDIQSFPHAVFLYFDMSRPSTCGSSLITLKAVVTSAHCLRELNVFNGRIQAFLGASVPMLAQVVRNITSYSVHPKYNSDKGYCDLGVAKFNREVPLMLGIRKIAVHSNGLSFNMTLLTAGWGKKLPTHFPDYSNSRFLAATEQRLATRTECLKKAGIKITAASMCSVPIRGYHYRGDLGNGLVTPNMALVGVVSFMVREVTMYANLMNQRRWLQSALKKLYGKEPLDADCC